MVDIISQLMGMDLTKVNQDILFLVCAVFLFMVIHFVYDILMMLFGYIGGKRR